MECYSFEHIERIFFRLKQQGKIDLRRIESLRPVLQKLCDIKFELGVVRKRRRRLKDYTRELNKQNEEGEIDNERINRVERLLTILNERKENLNFDKVEVDTNREEVMYEYLKTMLKNIKRGNVKLLFECFEDEEKIPLVSTSSIETAIVCQMIKDDLKCKYKVVPADRNEIISQLKAILDNDSPKVIIRGDIQSFFKSISFGKVILKLNNDNYLDGLSIRYLNRIWHIIRKKVPNYSGIPMGLAFSSYLAEIYMQSVDEGVLNMSGVYYYRRYVDDIIIIANLSHTPEQYWKALKTLIDGVDLRLHKNGSKKRLIIYRGEELRRFTYLGYRFKLSRQGLQVLISKNRFDRYKGLIDKIFNRYAELASRGVDHCKIEKGILKGRCSRHALRHLFSYLSCLTGNGHLSGDKANVSVGVYFSNKQVTDLSDFQKLDKYLSEKIETSFNPPSNQFRFGTGNDREWHINHIKTILHNYSFVKGFSERRFCKNPKFTDTVCCLKRLK